MRRNEILKIYNGIRELGKSRGWFKTSNTLPLGWSSQYEYIRIVKEGLKHTQGRVDHEILGLIIERIYEFIPEARNCKIRIYLTNGNSHNPSTLIGQAFTTL